MLFRRYRGLYKSRRSGKNVFFCDLHSHAPHRKHSLFAKDETFVFQSKTKVVLKRCFSRKSLIESFGKEIYNLQKFQGRGVVKYFENRSFGGDRYIVRDFVKRNCLNVVSR